MEQTGGWGVDLRRRGSTVAMANTESHGFMYSITTPFVPNGQY